MFHFHLLMRGFCCWQCLVAFMAYMALPRYIKLVSARKDMVDEDLLSRFSSTLTITHELAGHGAWIMVALCWLCNSHAVVIRCPSHFQWFTKSSRCRMSARAWLPKTIVTIPRRRW